MSINNGLIICQTDKRETLKATTSSNAATIMASQSAKTIEDLTLRFDKQVEAQGKVNKELMSSNTEMMAALLKVSMAQHQSISQSELPISMVTDQQNISCPSLSGCSR